MNRRRISPSERVLIFERADGRCHICGDKIEGGREPWDVEHVIPLGLGGTEDKMDENLQPAHISCHKGKTADDKGHIAKSKRMQQRNMGIPKQSRSPLPGGRKSKWKKKLDGTVVPR